MAIRPVTPEALSSELAELVAERTETWVRVAVDGADAARPGDLADALVEPIQVRGRAAVRVRAEDHLRPASLRFERGREDPDSFYDDWLDTEGLRREVLEPLDKGGTGHIRIARWDSARDRARREGFTAVPAGGVVIVSGPLLLGRGLPFDLTVHLELSAAALKRRTEPNLEWTLDAYERYREEVAPADWADVAVRWDDPRHPAVARSPIGA